MGSLDKAVLTGFVCRICSKISKVVIHVHGEEGQRLELVKLASYFKVDIQSYDFLPKTMCKNCIARLQAHNDWLNHIRKAQKKIERDHKAFQEKQNNHG